MRDLILFGVQGSGKSSVSHKILEHYGNKVSYFDAGTILRTLKSTDNVLGNYVRGIVESGNLVDDTFITSLFDTFFAILDLDQFILIDGFPRNVFQAYMILERLKKFKRKYSVVMLDLPEEEAIKRLSSRRICSKCQMVHNIMLDGDIKSCKSCTGNLIQRSDDIPEIIKKRIQVYHKETMPVIKLFEDLGVLSKVNVNRCPEKSLKDILGIIER